MTRFLSDSLQASEPAFRLRLRQLEQLNGRPNADIRLSSEVTQLTRTKLALLGLDPQDTTVRELYLALQSRLKTDDAALIKALRTLGAQHVSAEADLMDGLAHALRVVADSQNCFALKPSRLKSLLKQAQPKKTLKRLGYRSLDSMLKHEGPSLVLAGAWLSESASWRRNFQAQYKHVVASDFEVRPITILHPSSKSWQQLATTAAAHRKHILLSFHELGTLVLLPLPKTAPSGSTTASLVLALTALREIRAASTFLKLCQVRPDFGSNVQMLATTPLNLHVQALDQAIPWSLIQSSLHRLDQTAFERLLVHPIENEDIICQPFHNLLETIEPRFSFWYKTDHLALLHNRKPVSLNILDVALSVCNHLPFEGRLVHNFQQSLWHELLERYLQPAVVEQALRSLLQPTFALEPALA